MALASQDAGSASARADGHEPSVRVSSTARRRLNPTKLAYLIAPGAFALVFLLMRYGYVAGVHWWVWLTVFTTIVVVNLQMDRVYQARPNRLTLNLRVACQVVGVTIAIYLTGWGPVLWATYIFIALENLARVGSRVWKSTVIYSIIGMAVGQLALTQGWLPSELSRSESA